MLASGESLKEVIRPDFNRAIMIRDYAVRVDEWGNAAVKRVQEIEDVWILLSDNLEHNSIMIKKTDLPNLIIGRVI